MGDNADVTTVAVVDDHVMVAEMLALTITHEPDLRLIGVAPTIQEAYALVDAEVPDVILMDYRLPDGTGIEAGCVGLINKDRPVGDVLAAVRAAARGELVIRSHEFTGLLDQIRKSPEQKTQLLTSRELEVLQLLAKGRSTEGIGDDLFISINTVRNHVANILSKLGVHSKLEAVAIAAREGLINLAEGD